MNADSSLFSHHRFPFLIFPRFCSSLLKMGVTELDKGGDWQEPLQVIWSKPSVQTGTPRAPRPGPTPNLFFFFISPQRDTPPPPWAIYASAWSTSQQEVFPVPDIQRKPVFQFVPAASCPAPGRQ